MHVIKKMDNYFKEHSWQNAMYHFLTGMGIGLLIFSFVSTYSNILGWFLLGLGLLGHVWAFLKGKE